MKGWARVDICVTHSLRLSNRWGAVWACGRQAAVASMVDILVVGARGIPDVEGGAEKHAEMVFPRFASAGYEVTLLGIDRFIKGKEYRGVRLRGMHTLRIAQTDKLIYHMLCFLYAAWSRPKLVHLQGLNSALFLFLYKLVGLKVVVRYGSADHQHAKWGLIGRTGFRLCEHQIRYSDHVIAVSRNYHATLSARYGLERVTVVPNGTDPHSVSDEASTFWSTLGLKDAPYILAVGRLTVDKDYETLVRAIGMLAGSRIRLVVAGGVDESGHAERLFAMQNDRIRFLGRIERRLLTALYDRCAVYVNCSRYEGFSNALLEAISHNRPIVASDIPSNCEVPLQASSYFRTGDAAALADRLQAALNDPEAFIAEKDDFLGWDQIFNRTEAVYRSVVPALAIGAFRPTSPI
jgi:glycosyltransferase involved in cell wall biosynthesis